MQALDRIPLALALVLPCVLGSTACSEGDVRASEKEAAEEGEGGGLMDKVRGMELSELGADELETKARKLSESLASRLDEVRDEASAEKVRRTLEPVVQDLRRLRDTLGEKMPSLDALRTRVEDLRERYDADERVMETLRPLLDELEGLFAK